MNAPVDRAALASASLDDKYTLERGRVFLTGTQALIRLMMLQRERDARAGVNTAGFVSGYRGSPLGGLDQSLWRAKQHLERAVAGDPELERLLQAVQRRELDPLSAVHEILEKVFRIDSDTNGTRAS